MEVLNNLQFTECRLFKNDKKNRNTFFFFQMQPTSFCLRAMHSVTESGVRKIIFGKGTKLIIETSK